MMAKRKSRKGVNLQTRAKLSGTEPSIPCSTDADPADNESSLSDTDPNDLDSLNSETDNSDSEANCSDIEVSHSDIEFICSEIDTLNSNTESSHSDSENSCSDSEAGHSDSEDGHSNGEAEFERPLKKRKVELSSTPYVRNSTSAVDQTFPIFENKTSFENGHQPDGNYPSFSSFLESHSFISEDQDEPLTVSQLAQQRSDSSNLREISYTRKTPVKLNIFSQNVSTDNIETIRIIPVPSENLEIVSLQHPASLTLHGYINVSVLVGTVSVLGYDVKEDEHVNVFSTKRTGFKQITTKMSVHQKTKKKLRKKIKNIVGQEKNRDIKAFLECVGSATVVVVLKKSLHPPHMQFLELYFPQALQVRKFNRNNNRNLCSVDEFCVIKVNSDDELIAEQINTAIDQSVSDQSNTGPRILIRGPKQSGKSSLLRFLINKVLNTYPAVYYLDTDPGQTEFTPPGAVSLIKVTRPLLGPPFGNQRTPAKMIFTGSITAATSPPMYLKCVRNLIEHFYSNFPQEILFVNTMGWTDGIGNVCFQSIKTNLNPTILIDLLSPEELPGLKIETLQEEKLTHIQLPIKEYVKEFSFSSKDRRDFAVMSYLGQCQKYFMPPTYINAFRPVCVCWDNIAIYAVGKKVPPNRLIEVIHNSFLALCHVPESCMLESEQPEFPRTLQEESLNECLGFGFVRAADETNHLLYIVTPLTLEQLREVNTVIKGNVMVPPEVFLKQPILDTELPFTDQGRNAPAFNRKIVKKRAFRKSITQTPG